jgi:hypothetical protein
MSGNTSYCQAYDGTDELYGRGEAKHDRKLSIAPSFVPDLPEAAAQAQCDNLFCHIHPCTFLELRFTDTYETYWTCPECEKEAYLKRIQREFHKMGGTRADGITSGPRLSERETGRSYLVVGG